MQELRLCLLGSPQVFVDGEEKKLNERKAIAFLAYLVLERTIQSRDTLAALFWPEHDQQRARANLRYLLWSLRKTLGEGWLGADRDQIVLAGGGKIRVDVEAFRRYLAAWRTHSHAADTYCAICAEALEAAAKLYRSDFLQGFTLDDSPQFDDWQFFQTEALRRELAAGLEGLVEQQIVGQMYDDAIGHARRWLALDPLHEPACRALMKLYAWIGQYEAAIRQYHRCAQALQEEIGVEPDDKTQQLYAQIRNRRFPLPPAHQQPDTPSGAAQVIHASAAPGNLPPESTPFVGREGEMAQIAHALTDPATRLLSVIGPGGIGKTALALQAGRIVAGDFADGAWFVACANLPSPAHVPAAILSTLGIAAKGDVAPTKVLFAQLFPAKILLILDNFEDVLDAATFVADLLRACPQVKILITSRERLNLSDEYLLTLGSLAYPDDATNPETLLADPARYSALRLFALCAQRVQPGFALDATSLPAVIRICQLVDGMPLAVEMAAAWVRALPLENIPDEISKSISFLATDLRNVETRHHSIHAVFDHSWQMLTEQEQSIVRQLSIFRNGFGREAAQSVAGASLLHLSALLDKSWIRLTSSGRYQMHRLARQYALEKLHAEHTACTGESMADVLRRHSLYYAALVPAQGIYAVPLGEVENVKLAWQTTLDQREWQTLERLTIPLYDILQRWWNREILPMVEEGIRRMDAELQSNSVGAEERQDAIRVALARSLATAGEYHIHLGYISQSIGYLSRGRTLLAGEWQQSEAKGLAYAQITRNLAFSVYYHGEFVRAAALYEEALHIYAQLSPPDVPYTLLLLALVYDRVGRYNDAEKCLRPPAEGQWVPDRHEPTRLRVLGRVLTRQGKYSEAQHTLEESYPATVHRYRAHTLLDLGMAQRGGGKTREAIETFQRGLTITEETGDRPAQSDLLLELGFSLLQIGETDTAQNHIRSALTIAEAVGRKRNFALGEMGLGLANLQRGEMESARRHLVQALLSETTLNAPPDALNILAAVGAFYAAEGEEGIARDVLEIVHQHPATSAETRNRSLGLLRTLNVELGSSETRLPWEAADLRLQEVVRDTLTKLQNPDLKIRTRIHTDETDKHG